MAKKIKGSALLNHLEEKYNKKEFYTYISEILVALNPNENIDELYTPQMVKKYEGKSFCELPPHIFGIAYNVLRNLRVFNTSQSIIISGITGSGKTESTKILLKFFSDISPTFSTRVMPDSNILLEAFGNSSTESNVNSSRFIKLIQINYDSNSTVIGSKIEPYLFENNRVCVGSYANFHMFYYLRYGAPQRLKDQLSLEYCFSSLPENFKSCTSRNLSEEFTRVDRIIDSLGITANKKNIIYKFLAAILHLGNLEFESNSSNDIVHIIGTTEHHVEIAADLLELATDKLKSHLLYKIIQVAGSQIKCNLNDFEARKTRDTLVKSIYKHLIQFIISSINGSLLFDSKEDQEFKTCINILDIAGFECFNPPMNQFEQFCINFANEKIQNFIIQRLIHKETEWYKAEGHDLPDINFPGNEKILDLLENKATGLFQLLDNECKMKQPTLINFINTITSTHQNSRLFSTSISSREKNEKKSCCFIIRHFAQDVQYSTENFIENNAEKCSEPLSSLISETVKSLCSKDRNECIGSEAKSSTTRTMKRTAGLKFRIDLDLLLTRLKKTKSHFIHCIKTNTEQTPGIFKEDFISQQITSSGVAAYYDLMQMGFPLKVNISSLFGEMLSFLSPSQISVGKSVCCRILFLAIGFTPEEFKVGAIETVVRRARKHSLDKLYVDLKYSKEELKMKFKKKFLNYMKNIIMIRMQFLGKFYIAKKIIEKRECQINEIPHVENTLLDDVQETEIIVEVMSQNEQATSDPIQPTFCQSRANKRKIINTVDSSINCESLAQTSGNVSVKRQRKQTTKMQRTESVDEPIQIIEEVGDFDTTTSPAPSSPASEKIIKSGKVCPICSRAFSRGTHMRAHLKIHSANRTKVICSVPLCEKEYADVKAWSVHFSSHHKKQQHKLRYFEGKLEVKDVENIPAQSIKQLMLRNKELMRENENLKVQINTVLKIRHTKKLIQRSKKLLSKN